jgi:hypothetical protein
MLAESHLSLIEPVADDAVTVAARDSADRLAAELLYRIEHLSEREQFVRRSAAWDTLPNMPARLIWESLEPGAAAFFVVYKLMHEARSNLPKIYRAIAWLICSAQPERFGLVTYREQLWSVLASVDLWPEDLAQLTKPALEQFVLDQLGSRSKTDWLSRRPEDLKRDSSWIAERLSKNEALVTGMKALRRIQLSQQSAVTQGNVILNIPRKLETFAETVVSQAKESALPCYAEIAHRIAALALEYAAKDKWGVTTNISIPFDLITFEPDQRLRLIAMTRHKASRFEREDLRRRMVYLRFFAHYAFGERKPEDVDVVGAFYADKKNYHDEWIPNQKALFNPEELWSFDAFWNYIAGREGGGKLVEKVTKDAASILSSTDMIGAFRKFVSPEVKNDAKS